MSKRQPLTAAEKEYIRQRKEAGASHAEVAKELNCSPETIKKWWKYLRQGSQPRPRGRPKQGTLSTYPLEIREQAEQLKRAHPSWGAVSVKVRLKQKLALAEEELPSDSQLAAFFKEVCPETVTVYKRAPYPEQRPPSVTAPHQRWQMDGKEKVAVGETELATVLDIVDPYSHVFIASEAVETTTEKGWRKLSLAEVQLILRQAFSEWGLPQQIQTDREVVYVGPADSDFPSDFTLWLVGLDLEHIPSRSKQPTDQAQVERSHRIMGAQVWYDQRPDSLAAFQSDLTATRHLLNEAFPSRARHCHGQPPLVAHPQARHSGRPFHPALEWELFDLGRVDAYLAQQVWTRTVADNGTVSVAHHRYSLGRAYRGQTVSVTFDPQTRSFCFATAQGDRIADLPARGLDKADLIGYQPTDDWPTPAEPCQLPLPLFIEV